jgi:outer membrane protein assembly factor BamB
MNENPIDTLDRLRQYGSDIPVSVAPLDTVKSSALRIRRRRRMGAVGGLALASVVTAVALWQSGADTKEVQVADDVNGPVLVTSSLSAGDEALISGQLTVDKNQCVVLQTADGNQYLAVLPNGAAVMAAGDAFEISIPGQSEPILFSTPVRGGGGFAEPTEEVQGSRCPQNPKAQVAYISHLAATDGGPIATQ